MAAEPANSGTVIGHYSMRGGPCGRANRTGAGPIVFGAQSISTYTSKRSVVVKSTPRPSLFPHNVRKDETFDDTSSNFPASRDKNNAITPT